MSRRRRRLLQSLAAALATLPRLGSALVIQPNLNLPIPQHTLRALVDTLIPEDETPAASALGVDQALVDLLRRTDDYRRLIDEGAEWLDRSARALGAKSFHAANAEQRADIVRQAERAKAGTLPRRMFERVLRDALRLYYAEPATWVALGYAGPPQPAGFLDFERAPSPRR
jgi:hypothetical protein